MTGKILGFDIATKEGMISGSDGKRYKFTKESWKDSQLPMKELKVDFDIGEDGTAYDVYAVRDKEAENNSTIMGLLALAITFFLGFIGTFIVRFAMAKQSAGKAIIPTLIHFILTLILVFIPVIGWIGIVIVTIYYMIKNYQLVVNTGNPTHKYA